MNKYIAAFTNSQPMYPAFINISRNERLDRIIITIRADRKYDDAKGYHVPGDITEIALTEDEWLKFVAEINEAQAQAGKGGES